MWTKLHDEALEARVAPVISVIGHCRSTKATYGIADNVKPEVFFRIPAGELRTTVQDFMQGGQINALARVQSSMIDGDQIPAGCAQEACEGVDMFLMVKGHVDIDKQVVKLEKAITFLESKVEKETEFLTSEHAAKAQEGTLDAKKKALDEAKAELEAKTATLIRYRSL
jgi:valyl-tRNA synthetase